MEEINLNKTVYSKGTYSKIIDTSFSQLGVKTIQEQVDGEIEALQKEITELRIELLDSQKRVIELETGITLE